MDTASTKLRFHTGLDKFTKFLHQPSKVLDVGFGQGNYADALQQLGCSVTSLCSDEGVKNLYQIENVEIIKKSPFDIILPYRSLDGIWARDTMINLSKQQTTELLSKYIDLLLPSGILYFCMMEGEGSKVVQKQISSNNEPVLFVYYQPEEIESIIQNVGGYAVDAWYENQADRRWIHVIVKRNI